MDKILLKKSLLTLITPLIIWTIVVLVSFVWNINAVNRNTSQTVKSVGRAFFREIETTRLWNAQHGGVYVPITDKTQPNPYLDVPNRDIESTTGVELTKVNPAFMTRQIAEVAQQANKIQYHITSLNPIRPANAASDWETPALQEFENGVEEFFAFDEIAQNYRYMAHLPVEEACLKCHAKQGYKLGEVRGGISVTIEGEAYLQAASQAKNNLTLMHGIVLFGGAIAYSLFWRFRENQMLILEEKNANIEQSNQRIMDSIHYAERIQGAILPTAGEMEKNLNDYFVVYKPKDIVSGDFYWLAQIEDEVMIAVADCTGHGVPGALLAMIGDTLLRKIVMENGITDPAKILERLHEEIRFKLKQEDKKKKRGERNDGMDIALCRLDRQHKNLIFAGANRPLYHVKNAELHEIKGDRRSIGGRQRKAKRVYSRHEIKVEPGDMIYLSSDGIVDHPNQDNKKFGSTRLKELLQDLAQYETEKQQEMLLSAVEKHQSLEKQRDDMVLLGIKI